MIQSGNTCAATAVPSGAGGEQGAAAVTAAAVLKRLLALEYTVCFRVFDNKEGSTFCRIMKLVYKCPACPSPAITADGQLTQFIDRNVSGYVLRRNDRTKGD